jgi:2-polyprenyl-3-methyl-5-hydroxy-6-metoxy-1,4-benzoquinol methylase
MNYRLKKIVKQLAPPVLLDGMKAVGRLVRGSGAPPFERSPAWYDRAFSRTVEGHKHYTEAKHHFLWAVLADRMVRDGVRSVLDIGCGSGQLALFLRDQGIPRYCGVDFSENRLSWARRSCPGFSFVLADAFQTDLLETFAYDAVVCAEFLNHVQEDIGLVRRIRKGARFYGIVANSSFASHVRVFRTAPEVRTRYADFFEDFRVNQLMADRKGKAYFVMEGVRR